MSKDSNDVAVEAQFDSLPGITKGGKRLFDPRQAMVHDELLGICGTGLYKLDSFAILGLGTGKDLSFPL